MIIRTCTLFRKLMQYTNLTSLISTKTGARLCIHFLVQFLKVFQLNSLFLYSSLMRVDLNCNSQLYLFEHDRPQLRRLVARLFNREKFNDYDHQMHLKAIYGLDKLRLQIDIGDPMLLSI